MTAIHGRQHGLFALAKVGTAPHSSYRIGSWCESYAEALEVYHRYEGPNYRGHRLRLNDGRIVNVVLAVRGSDEPAFSAAPLAGASRLRIVRGNPCRSVTGAARAFARAHDLDGRCGWFRRRASRRPAGPVVAHGLNGLARACDAHERDAGQFFYSEPVNT